MNKLTVLAVVGAAMSVVAVNGVAFAADAVSGVVADEQALIVVASDEDSGSDDGAKTSVDGKTDTGSTGEEGKDAE